MHHKFSTLEKDLTRLEIFKMIVRVKTFTFVETLSLVFKAFKELDDQLLMLLLCVPFLFVVFYISVEHFLIFLVTVVLGSVLKWKPVVFDIYLDYCFLK